MPSDQTPLQPGVTAGETAGAKADIRADPTPPQAIVQDGPVHDGPVQEGQDVDFSQALAGESGDPIWESYAPQGEAGRAERARRAVREPEGKLPPGRIIELDQHAARR